MFQVCLHFVLQFIGVRREVDGCTAVELHDYLCEDVLPYCGWAANETLCDTVLRLLLTEHADLLHLYTSGMRSVTAAQPRVRTKGQTKAGTKTMQQERSEARQPVTAIEAIALLDKGALLYAGNTSAPTAGSASRGTARKGSAAVLLHLCATHALREQTLDLPLHSEMMRQVTDYLTECNVQGVDRLRPNKASTEVQKRYRSHLLSQGINWLIRRQAIATAFLYDHSSHRVTHRYFPLYAAPLTELEKRAVAGDTALTTSPDALTPPASTSTPAVTSVSPTCSTDAIADHCSRVAPRARQDCRGRRPLDHYFARQRQSSGDFPAVVFDPGLVKYVVKTSPERRLLLQDAVRAILTVHGLGATCWEDFDKQAQLRFRQMLGAVGLRLVIATVVVRRSPRRVRLVMPAEDVAQRLTRTPAMGHQRREATEGKLDGGYSGDADGVATAPREAVKTGDKDDAEGTSRRAQVTAGMDDEALSSVKGVKKEQDEPCGNGAAAGSGSSSSSSSEEENEVSEEGGSGSDDDTMSCSASSSQNEAQTTRAPRKLAGATQRRTELATATFFLAPELPVELQVGREAERRPVALTAVYPRLLPAMNEKARGKSLGNYMEGYARRRRTLETHYVLTTNSKSFTLVYEPKAKGTLQEGATPTVPATAVGREQTPKAEASAIGGETPAAAVVAGGAASMVPKQKMALDDVRGARFRLGDPGIPKGLSAYALNTVLEALEAAPLHALTMAQLGSLIDSTVLGRRLLPYLRATGKITTSGVTPSRCRRRVGLVLLAGTMLTEEQKLLVAQEAATTQGKLDRVARTAPPPTYQAVPTDLVLHTLPATPAGMSLSALARQLLEARPQAKRLVDKILVTRNGYTRHASFRAGRMHLELWQQWYTAAAALAEDELPVTPPARTTLSGQVVYDNMSFSTFCVVCGMAAIDVSELLQQRPQSCADTSAPALCNWGQPLRTLPTTVQDYCRERGTYGFVHALSLLQQRGLIVSAKPINVLEVQPLAALSFTLAEVGTLRGHSSVFWRPAASPGSTAYMVLRYWLPMWGAVYQPRIPHLREVYETNTNISVPQMVALGKVLRTDVGVLSEALYQRCGLPLRPSPRRSLHEHATSRTTRGRRSRRKSRGGARTAGGGKGDGRVGRARARSYRVELTGATVGGALRAVFRSGGAIPRQLQEVLLLVERNCRQHMANSVLLAHAIRDGVRGQQRYHNGGAHPYHYPLPGAAGAGSDRSGASEALLRHGAALERAAVAYSRLTSPAVVHLALLGGVVRRLALRLVPPSASAGVAPHTITRQLQDSVEAAFAPEAGAQDIAAWTAQRAAAEERLRELAGNSNSNSGGGVDGALFGGHSALFAAMDSHATMASRQGKSAAYDLLLELAMDTLRMVLLSDKAHYSVSTAKALLLHFPAGIVAKARAELQRCSAYRRRPEHGRLPQLALGSSPRFLAPPLIRSAPRQGSNAGLLHALCYAAQEAMPATSPHSLLFLTLAPMVTPQPTCGLVPCATRCEAMVRMQPVMDVGAGADGERAGTERDDALAALRLPQLVWSPRGYALERARAATTAAVVVDDTAGPVSVAGPSHKRERAADDAATAVVGRTDGRATQDSTSAAAAEDDDEDDEEEEEDGFATQADGLAAAESTARELYPARALADAEDCPELESMPTDATATDAERVAVASCVAFLQHTREMNYSNLLAQPNADFDTLLLQAERSGTAVAHATQQDRQSVPLPSSCALHYPSIFHHVDGAFHNFVWKTFLTALYRYVLCVPGISHRALGEAAMASGLVSQRAFEAAVRALVASCVLRCTGSRLPGALYDAFGGGEDEQLDDVASPFAVRRGSGNKRRRLDSDDVQFGGARGHGALAVCSDTRCYHATVLPGGLWDMAQLEHVVTGADHVLGTQE